MRGRLGLLRMLGVLLLLALVGGAQLMSVAASQTDQDQVLGADGVLDSTDEGYLSEDVDGDGLNEIGIDEDESGTLEEDEVLGTDANNDEVLTADELNADLGGTAAAGATPSTGTLGVFGDDERFDASDEGFLREDLDGDGTFEIGFDEDASGTLEEDEVLGSDVDNDEGLGAPLTDGEAAGADDATDEAGTADFAAVAGDDDTFDASDEGFLREDLDGDGTFEIGFDEDASGTLEEDEVLGTDANDDDALTADEFSAARGATTDAAASFETAAGADRVLEANDEGYLSEDLNDDGFDEIGLDRDRSGTLDEDEVFGTDANNDDALTVDELGD